MKLYPTYDDIHLLARDIANKANSFKPDVIVAIGGGGLIPARIMRSILNVPVLVITLESYSGEQQQDELLRRQWLNDPVNQISGLRVLLVDELNDTGRTLEYAVTALQEHAPTALAVAVLHHKNKLKQGHVPDDVRYIVGEHCEDNWIVYPWEA